MQFAPQGQIYGNIPNFNSFRGSHPTLLHQNLAQGSGLPRSKFQLYRWKVSK